MTESFAQLFEESLKEIETRPGTIVKGTVVAIDNGYVLVDAGLKSESAIPAEQFKNAYGDLEIEIGTEVDVALDAIEDGFGETQLSREKAKRHEAWIVLENAYEKLDRKSTNSIRFVRTYFSNKISTCCLFKLYFWWI